MTLYSAIDTAAREVIENALRKHEGNQSRAARQLGVHRNTLSYWLDKLGIDPSAFLPQQPA